MDDNIRDKLIDIILKVAMQHHDDISKSDEDAACDAVDEIIQEVLKDKLLGHLDKDGDCYYCGKKTNSLAMSPSEWPVFLCHADDPGKIKPHHVGCVIQRLESWPPLWWHIWCKIPYSNLVSYYWHKIFPRKRL